MKKIIVFITYCNTEEKKILLKKNLNYIKLNYKEYDTLVFAHYPLEEEIQNLSTYYFYDPSNPVIRWPQKEIIYWVSIPNSNMKGCKAMDDYGFTTINQLIKGLQITNSFSYDITYFINYDVELENNFQKLKSISESSLENSDIFTLFFYGQSNIKDSDAYDLRFFSCRTDITIKKLEGLLTLKSYLKSQYTTGESFLKNCIDYSDLKCEVLDKNLEFIAPTRFFENLTVLDDTAILKNMNKTNSFFEKLFVGRFGSNSMKMSFWDFKKDVYSIKLKINDTEGVFVNYIEPFYKSGFIDLPTNTKKINIEQINGEPINELVPLTIDKQYLINNYYE